MTMNSSLNLRWTSVVAGAVALLAMGAGAAYLFLSVTGAPRTDGPPEAFAARGSGRAAVTPASEPPSDGPLPDVVVTLSEDAAARAGLTTSTVAGGVAAEGLRLPAVVEPNAYRQVVVTPLVAGRLTRVFAELGQRVRRGEPMAEIFSPELAAAHTRYASVRAELEAHERELQRTARLVEIGAASRQELERIHAEHTAKTADMQSARSRLELLGVQAHELDDATGEVRSSAEVPAPLDGVVTERLANVGLNVDLGSKLFTVVDLSTVWVVADLYERDFSRVSVGSPATVTTHAYPDLLVQGRVNYIDPQVSGQTRTAELRVEVQNPRSELRLGMYADVRVIAAGASAAATTTIPRIAVQTVGDRHVVYLVDPMKAGTFTEREVHLGSASGARIEVRSGVRPGDVVVAEGSFFVRAERERLGLRPSFSVAR